MTIPPKDRSASAGFPHRTAESFSERFLQHRHTSARARAIGKKPLRVLKFGGTSVGDVSCIERVTDIIQDASRESDLVVVVSAMSGVTNKLVAAASYAQVADEKAVSGIFTDLRRQHNATASELIRSGTERNRIQGQMEALFQTGDRLCRGTMLLGELTARTRDAISSLGERLSVLLVAAALNQLEVPSEAIEATELIVTDACHGAADPCMEATRQRCETRLRPVLQRGVIPVVTGFIGATADGVLTTLGRGGSDYSATIVGAALEVRRSDYLDGCGRLTDCGPSTGAGSVHHPGGFLSGSRGAGPLRRQSVASQNPARAHAVRNSALDPQHLRSGTVGNKDYAAGSRKFLERSHSAQRDD